MRTTVMKLAAAATLAIAAIAATAPAQAYDGFGPGLAAGLVGGAIVGSALAGPGYYGPGYGYYGPRYYGPPRAYVADPGYYGPCYWQRQQFWDGFAWRVRRVRVCD